MTTAKTLNSIKYTHIDLALAKAYYRILAEFVDLYRSLSPEGRANWQMTYGDLIVRAKEEFPDVEAVQRATSINTGRRLGVIRQIANGDCPDMSCLVFNKASNEVGSAYQAAFDPAAERAKLLEEFYRNTFDFHKFEEEFFSRIEAERSQLGEEADHPSKNSSAVSRKKKITEEDAANLCFQYYRQHKASLPTSIVSERDRIVEDIMNGIAVDVAFQNAVARLGSQPPDATQPHKKANK